MMHAELGDGYEMWEEVPRLSIPHSRLYDLEPIGVGSSMVESLTSYITRLADAHSVFPTTLVTSEIWPCVNPPHLRRNGGSVSGQLNGMFRESALLNGVAGGTEDWVLALEHLTGRRDLHGLTLLAFSKVLPQRWLLRRKRAWCPLCYQEWWEAGLLVYDPLLWSLECVSVCVNHHLPLSRCCPYPDCAAILLPLEPKLFPGYCPKCHRWMGQPEGSRRALADDEWPWQLWVVQTLGELLAAGPGLAIMPPKERIATHLSTYLNTFLDGSGAELARQLNSNESSIRDWLAGKQLPHLGNLLRLSFLFGTTPLGFLTEKAPQRKGPLQSVPQKSLGVQRRRRPMRRFDVGGIGQALEVALCEEPAPSMRQVARRLGYDPSQVYKYFPDLCQAISRRRMDEQARNKQIRFQRKRDELREVMRKLASQGLYPSRTHIQKVLSKPGLFRDTRMRVAWDEVLQELGWKS